MQPVKMLALFAALLLGLLQNSGAQVTNAVPARLEAGMVVNEASHGNPEAMVDEPPTARPPAGSPTNAWATDWRHVNEYPISAYLDLGTNRALAALWIFDTYDHGELVVSAGAPGNWQTVLSHDTRDYMRWTRLPLDRATRYLRLTRTKPGTQFAEIALDEYTPEGWQAFEANRAAAARRKAERDAALRQAQEELARRPVFEIAPFGRVQLVDEVECGAVEPGHGFRQSPEGASQVTNILGRPCRVLRAARNEASFMAFRLGQWKLLKPGGHYVLAVDYPEDQPRSLMVMNGGNETSRGFHTGTTVGDALHSKYVNSNPESLRVPLSGRFETWTHYFNLHDRFPDLGFLRGPKPRKLAAEDGFDVAIAQFSQRNDPTSAGAAAARIRLFEVLEPSHLVQPLALPPAPLPRRHLFWREEMADGVIESDRAAERGVRERLDWYRYKANQMRFLGMNTFSKDLLEFGACQHWDPTPYGGNAWVHFASGQKDLWAQIVGLMGEAGFGVLPYYEYAGSKGERGLGYQRRCKPLTRDDAYTHISWIESANADITDPDTAADLGKMLDLTVVRLRDRARFEGIWLRPRSQWPMSFSDAARERFAREANGGKSISRADLIADAALRERYEGWWFGKRREFLLAMRDRLRTNGLPNALVLFTAEAGEPGPTFPTWEKRLVTDDPASWAQVLAAPEQLVNGKLVIPIGLDRVVRERLYLEALQAASLNWGNWEVHHANPPADPRRYRDASGVLLTHAINRRYTAISPETFDAFRGPSGLAVVRHYALNEHMMFDARDQDLLGYFVADIERAGPYCMMAEALAVAHGDPTHIGYLSGGNFGRGFPRPARQFNAHFLALPALPGQRLRDACDDAEVAVRAIPTPSHGLWLAVVNTGLLPKKALSMRPPRQGRVIDAVSGETLEPAGGGLRLALEPCQLRALRVLPPDPGR